MKGHVSVDVLWRFGSLLSLRSRTTVESRQGR